MDETFESIGKWAVETFDRPSQLACLAKLAEEFGELARYIQHDTEYGVIPEEMADIIIVLSHMAASHGYDLQGAINYKMRVNRSRQWRIHKVGTASHVPGGTQEGV